MAIFKPFRPLRPKPELAEKVAALPYDVYTTAEAREAAKGNPYSFLHVDKAEIDLDDGVGLYEDIVYKKAKENFLAMSDWMEKDEAPCFYIYTLEMGEFKQTGIVGLTSVNEYLNGTIKKHEHTREDKEKDRIRHILTLDAQTGPIFLAYKSCSEIKETTHNHINANMPLYDMVFKDGTKNTVWRVSDAETVNTIESAFKSVPALYIADGHHRNAAAAKAALLKREEGMGDKDEPHNFYLAVLFPDDELNILDYNRVVKDLNNLSEQTFINKISEHFEVSEGSGGKPARRHEFGMYLSGKWYLLKAKAGLIDENDPLKRLDVSVLQDFVLGPVLGIEDVRTNKRIDFIGGIRGTKEIERRVDSGEMKAGFSMFPTSIKELMSVADIGKVMPPKSTWFEPKLRSGLFIHEI